MSDLISREEVLKLPQRKGYAVNGWETYIRVSDVKELPSVQLDKDMIHLQKEQAYMQGYEDGRKSRKGKWINAYPDIEPNPMFMYGICSVCGYEQAISDKLNFCPNCGADMRKREGNNV